MDYRRALCATIRWPLDRLLNGNDLEGDQDRHELELLKMTWNLAANIGLHTAWRRAQDRTDWRNFVKTGKLH